MVSRCLDSSTIVCGLVRAKKTLMFDERGVWILISVVEMCALHFSHPVIAVIVSVVLLGPTQL